MVADLIEKGRVEYLVEWVGEDDHKAIVDAVGRLGAQWLRPLRDVLPENIADDQIRLVVAFTRKSAQTTPV